MSLVATWYTTLKIVLLNDIDCYSFLSIVIISILFCLCYRNKGINNKKDIYRAMAEFEVSAYMRHCVGFEVMLYCLFVGFVGFIQGLVGVRVRVFINKSPPEAVGSKERMEQVPLVSKPPLTRRF